MDRLVVLLAILSWTTLASALSCLPCNISTCENVTCVGTVVKDICGCCPACSKQRGEQCGGPWDIFGICDTKKNLTCYKFVRPEKLELNVDGTCQPKGIQDRCTFPRMFTACASACQSNCEEPDPDFCTEQCVVDKCVCGTGFIQKSRTNDTCIPREQCERLRPRECEGLKMFRECATACPATCGDPHPYRCTKNCNSDPCICPSGYLMKSLTDKRCIRAFECEDFSFCDKICPRLSMDSPSHEFGKAWSCELDNWKCNTYKWKREMEQWWSASCSADVSKLMGMWKGLSNCYTVPGVRCTNPEYAETHVDAFGCVLSRCSDGKYEDAGQPLGMWRRNFDGYMKYMQIYKRVREMCDLVL